MLMRSLSKCGVAAGRSLNLNSCCRNSNFPETSNYFILQGIWKRRKIFGNNVSRSENLLCLSGHYLSYKIIYSRHYLTRITKRTTPVSGNYRTKTEIELPATYIFTSYFMLHMKLKENSLRALHNMQNRVYCYSPHI